MEVSSKRGRFALALVFGCSVAVLVCLFAAGRLPAEWHDLPAKLAVLVFAVWGFRRVRQCWPHPSPNVGRLTAEAALAGLLNPLAGNAFAIAMTLILLRFGAAFSYQSFIIASPFVILVLTGSHWHFASG